MEANARIDHRAGELSHQAWAFHEAAGRTGSSAAALDALTHLEEALGVLSAGWYDVSADPAPRLISSEEEMQVLATLHDLAANFAGCARQCREARHKLEPLIGVSPQPVPAIR